MEYVVIYMLKAAEKLLRPD